MQMYSIHCKHSHVMLTGGEYEKPRMYKALKQMWLSNYITSLYATDQQLLLCVHTPRNIADNPQYARQGWLSKTQGIFVFICSKGRGRVGRRSVMHLGCDQENFYK